MATYVTWVDPHGPTDYPVYSYMLTSDAIKAFRQTHEVAYREMSDDFVLDDFCAVNWATVVDCELPS